MRKCQYRYKATSYLADVIGCIFEITFSLIGYILFTPIFILLLVVLAAVKVLH